MKKLTSGIAILGCLLICFFVSSAYAHDGDFGTITFDSMDMQSALHDETIGQVDPCNPVFKGWAFVGLQNNTSVSWTDFHFKLTTSDPCQPVIFVTSSPYEPVTSIDPNYLTSSLSNGDTELDFYFPGDPVAPSQVVTFQLYTDNTAYNNDSFTICMTPTPEPTTIALLGLGGLALLRKRR